MFSTTFPDELQKRARQFLRENYIFIAVDTIKDISETIEEVRKIDKIDRLLQLFEQNLSIKQKKNRIISKFSCSFI